MTLRSPKPIITQSNEWSCERQPLGVRDHALDVADEARVDEPVAAAVEHRRIDVGEDYAAPLADLAQHADRQVARAARDVERAASRTQPRQ